MESQPGLIAVGGGIRPSAADSPDSIPRARVDCKKAVCLTTTLNVGQIETMAETGQGRGKLFEEAAAEYGAALERLARAYEADPETRRDLLQEIQIALWTSLANFDNRCSLRTWVYRVAHNTAASHVAQRMRMKRQVFVGIDELLFLPDRFGGEEAAEQNDALARVYELIHQLAPLDRQVMLAYLEGMDAATTAEITGLSARNVATKIHRIKHALKCRFQEGGRDER
jgi:RNA polymerase sigma-70 factor (ECF subfamily)